MPETLPCPTCAATLRVPPGADKIRCPRCKTVLDVAAPGAAAAAPVPRAVPLPFDPPPAPPDGPPAPPPPRGKPARRGKLVHDDDPPPDADDRRRTRRYDHGDDDEPATAASRAAAKDARKDARILEAFEELARPARTGMRLMAFGAVASCAASLLYFLAGFCTLIVPAMLLPLVGLAGTALGLHWLLTVIGFGFCCGGPKEVRGMAASGIAVMVLHLLLYAPLLINLLVLIDPEEVGFRNTNGRGTLFSTLLLSNLFNNLTTVTDLPVYLFGDGLARPQVLILPVIAGAFEFAKLSLLGVITNHYAVEGKDPELGYLALRFVYRIFWLVIIGTILKAALWLLVKLTGGEPLLLVWFAVPVSLLTQGYFLWWAFAWYAQCQVMFDTITVIDPQRFADKRERLGEV